MPEVTSERWRQIESLFERVLGQPSATRDALLANACGDDPALRMTVEHLLHMHDRADGFLEQLDTGRAAALIQLGSTPEAEAQTVGRYRVVRRLGRGGMAVVYLARDERLDRPVALKLLPPWVAADGVAARRLLEEAKAASSLDHPHIITIYEIGETADDRLFLAMAFHEGETLRERISRGPLTADEAADLAAQIASGLAAAHRKGIVHRDIKPENILVTTDGVVKILDFGIAKLEGQALTRPGLTPGTAAYMSPEQTRGQPVDGRSDLWSLGVVLYEMLAGVRPFPAGTAAVVIHAIQSGDAPHVHTLRPDVPSPLATVVHRCLARDPDQRWASAEDVLAALRMATDDAARDATDLVPRASPPHALPVRSGTPVRAGAAKRLLSRRGAVAAVAAGALVLAVSSQLVDRRSIAAPDMQRVVVAPFENRTGDPALDVLGSMAADWIIQGLARTGLVDVVPFSVTLGSARSAAGGAAAGDAPARLQALARETGAGIVISGSYYQVGDSIHAQSRATHATDATLIAAFAPVSAPTAQPMAALEALRHRVMAGLAPHVDPRMRDYARFMGHTPSWDAYREYALGTERLTDGVDWRSALAHFARASEYDPDFALPLVRTAVIHSLRNDMAAADSVVRLLLPRLATLAEFDREMVGIVAGLASADYRSSLEAARRAAELAPNSWAHFQLANTLVILNRPHEALRVFEQMDPQRGEMRGWFFYWIRLTETLHRLELHERELQVARNARDHFPESNAVTVQVRALAALGRLPEALQVLHEHLATPGTTTRGDMLQHIARELHVHGHFDAAQDVFQRSLAWFLANAPRASGPLGEAYYRVGQWEDADRVLRSVSQPEGRFVDTQLGLLGVIAAGRGDRVAAEQVSARLASLERPYLPGEHTFWRARIAALLGDHDAAIALLSAAYRQGYRWWFPLHFEPDFDSLRPRQDFQELLRPKV